MALSSATVWETRASGASDNNGGGWAPTAIFSGTDLVVDGTLNTKVTSAVHNFVAADVGTRILISNAQPSAWTAGFYTINSVAANAATLSASPAAVGTTSGVWAEVGLEYSAQNAAQVAIDNSTVTTSITANVITFTGYTPTLKDVGNVVQMLTGTNVTAGFYQITAITATTWTVTGAVALPTSGTTTNATGNMGGALATLGKLAAAVAIGSNKAYATGAYTSTATATFAPSSVTPSGSAPPTRLIGYGSTRGDGVRATLTLSTNTGLTGIASASNGFHVENFAVDCASLGTSTGIGLTGQYAAARNCKVSNFATRGIQLSVANSGAFDSEATGGVAGATAAIDVAGSCRVERCNVHDNACPGLICGNTAGILFNLVTNNSGASSDGITVSYSSTVLNNTVHNSGRDGVRMSGTFHAIAQQFRNNILSNNGGYGANQTATAVPANPDNDGNAYYSNSSGARNGLDSTTGIFGVSPYTNVRDVTLSVSPYVGPTTGSTADFGLNTTAGGGAACRAAGKPGTWPGNSVTTGYLDMGAVQHQDPASTGGPVGSGRLTGGLQ